MVGSKKALSPELRLAGLEASVRCAQLFSGLPPADVSCIAALSQPVALAKGEYLFREGEPSRGFFLVRTGAINVHRVSAAGREQVIHVFRAGETFAEAALASPTGYPADARAVEAGSVLLFPKRPMLDLLAGRPDLALRMLGSMSAHLRVLVGMLDDLTLKDAETRVLNWIVQRCPPAGAAEVRLASTKRVLAAELATSSETLSRTFARLRDAGLIEVRGLTVRVRDAAALRARFRRLLGEA
ncbi:MAG: Crp/Fnr family transcriptional regulator [Opitutaceae bacterium]|nr:Crp/Fnr family transcriptional regulator [Opitutaceae bacterium]